MTANRLNGRPLSATGAKSRQLTRSYMRLLVRRCSYGLLWPFRYSECGITALDPIGWNGPGQPLCELCADPTGGPA